MEESLLGFVSTLLLLLTVKWHNQILSCDSRCTRYDPTNDPPNEQKYIVRQPKIHYREKNVWKLKRLCFNFSISNKKCLNVIEKKIKKKIFIYECTKKATQEKKDFLARKYFEWEEIFPLLLQHTTLRKI